MFKKKYLLFPLALLFLVPMTVFAIGEAQGAPPAQENSLQIFIDGTPLTGPISKGTVIPQERVDGECGNPSYLIQAGADVQRVKLGPKEDSCDIEVKTLEMNETPFPANLEEEASASAYEEGYTWRVKTMAKIVGIVSIDDLTRTRSELDVKTASSSNTNDLFGGVIILQQCWAHYEKPAWKYTVERCVKTNNTTSSTKMFAKTHGYYGHEKFASFAHDVLANAIVRGNKSIPSAFSYECYQNSKPIFSDLECYFDWEYRGHE